MTSVLTAPVVLLHGVGLDRTMWMAVEQRLASRPIALDLPGHGDQPPLRGTQTLRGLAEDVLSRMPEEPVHLVGFSLGALVAQGIALKVPARVRSLTCVSSVYRRSEQERAGVRNRLTMARTDPGGALEASLARWFPVDSAPDRKIVQRIRERLGANDHQSFLAAYEVFAEGDRELATRLPALKVPLLAITGALDGGSTPAMSEALAAAVPHGVAVIVPDARHLLPLERPGALAAAIETFAHQTESEEAVHGRTTAALG